MKRKYFVSFFIIVILVLLGINIFLTVTSDREAPVISFTPVDITYTETLDKSRLLEGVTAEDDIDGDVTSMVIVEKVKITSDGKNAIVTYAARDKSYNVSKANRLFPYYDYGIQMEESSEPEEGTTEETAAEEQTTEEESQSEPAETEEQEPEDDSPEPEGEAEDTAGQPEDFPRTAGIAQVDTQIDEQINQAARSPKLQLNTNEVTLKTGEPFVLESYIAALEDDQDDFNTLFSSVRVEGEYRPDVAGDYQVRMYVVDSEGNTSETIPMIIHVVE